MGSRRRLIVPVKEGTVHTDTWAAVDDPAIDEDADWKRGVVVQFRAGEAILELRMELPEFEKHLETLNSALPFLRRELADV